MQASCTAACTGHKRERGALHLAESLTHTLAAVGSITLLLIESRADETAVVVTSANTCIPAERLDMADPSMSSFVDCKVE